MTVDKRLLRERAKMNKARPKFRRQESWRYKRLSKSWRKPVGIDNSMRHHKRGIPKIVRIGYRGPKAVRGLTSNGMEEVLVQNVNGLEQIDKKVQVVRIGATVGVKKKVAITNRADELEIKIINRPEEALSFASLSDISEDYLLDGEDDKKKSKSPAKKPRKKKPSTGLTEKEMEELEKLESELKTGTKARATTKPKATTTKPKTTTTKKPTPAKKPASTTKKATTTTAKKTSSTTKKTTTSSKTAADKKKTATASKKK
jgi:large subunit ribosomal protein L32e